MWILAKHPAPTDGPGNQQFYLLTGRKYVVGRKDCDIVIPGDISISRRHATISVSNGDPGDPEQPDGGINIVDTSKIGVLLNGKKITQNEATTLKHGDLISFGRLNMKYKLIHEKLVIVTSCINTSSSKAKVRSCLQKLGGYMSSNWTENATHLVMEKVTFTLKVVCAIACGKPVVSVQYLEDLLDSCDKKTGNNLPHESKYLPPVTEKILANKELLFHPNLNRSSLMVGKLFIVLVSQQCTRTKEAIQYAGGEVILKDRKDGNFVHHISNDCQTIVMQVEKKDEKDCNEEQIMWIKTVYAKLAQQNLRAIRESEIGLAILHASLDQYCNPTLNTAPTISGSTHTQVMVESMAETQQTQNLPDPTDETQPLEDIPNSQVNHSVSIAPKKSIDVISTKNLSSDGRFPRNASKRKRPIGSQNDPKNAQQSMEHFFKKPKLKNDHTVTQDSDECNMIEIPTDKSKDCEKNENNLLNVLTEGHNKEVELTDKTVDSDKPKPEKEINIVEIEDDDDEDDVFSINFSKPSSATKTLDESHFESITCTNKVDETLSSEKLAAISKDIRQLNPPTSTLVNAESDVLFTSFSKNRVPESCQSGLPESVLPSAVTPLCKKTILNTTSEKSFIPDSCPVMQRTGSNKSTTDTHASSYNTNRKYDFDDDDNDDDDPFSFSVDITSTKIKSSCKEKDHNKSYKSTEKGSVSKSDTHANRKLVSDSDTSVTKSVTDDEKQISRFLKATSSSQGSEEEGIYVSDEGGNLIPKENQQENIVDVDMTEANAEENDVDLSYLLDDEDVVSKEYSLQKQKNSTILNGFISTLDMRPKKSIIKEEDPDLIGIDMNVVQTDFVSLVVKEPKKKPRKTCDIPGSKLKNYKTFKKQYFAGRSIENKVISKYDMVAYESDNVDRAALFADIRDKDEEEAAENRRIDKMFDVMSRRKK